MHCGCLCRRLRPGRDLGVRRGRRTPGAVRRRQMREGPGAGCRALFLGERVEARSRWRRSQTAADGPSWVCLGGQGRRWPARTRRRWDQPLRQPPEVRKAGRGAGHRIVPRALREPPPRRRPVAGQPAVSSRAADLPEARSRHGHRASFHRGSDPPARSGPDPSGKVARRECHEARQILVCDLPRQAAAAGRLRATPSRSAHCRC